VVREFALGYCSQNRVETISAANATNVATNVLSVGVCDMRYRRNAQVARDYVRACECVHVGCAFRTLGVRRMCATSWILC
jgi:hypothetical protein